MRCGGSLDLLESLLLIKEEPRKVILRIKCTYESLGDRVEMRILIQ